MASRGFIVGELAEEEWRQTEALVNDGGRGETRQQKRAGFSNGSAVCGVQLGGEGQRGEFPFPFYLPAASLSTGRHCLSATLAVSLPLRLS